jgi:hypothetical protein|nr:MAG TPA: hypothetical protein [Caudoviricetes sp.]
MKHEIMFIKNELNWWERILFRVFRKTFVKVFNISRINIINKALLK